MSGSHRAQVSAGRHRAPAVPLAERLAPHSGIGTAALGGIAVGTLSVAATALVPGLGATAAFALGDGGDTPGNAPEGATIAVEVPAGAKFAAPSGAELARLRQCESTGRYDIATGNGFYGAYQFDLQTWRSLGLGGSPQLAQPPLQDAAANALEQSRGWQPWPSCSNTLGLLARRAHGLPASEVLATLDPTVSGTATPVVAVKQPGGKHRAGAGSGPTAVSRPTAPTFAVAAPPFAGHVLSIADHGKYRSDVRLWQERMAARGWTISPDGYFGPRSQAVAVAFAFEKNISDGFPGEVGTTVWAATWEAAVD